MATQFRQNGLICKRWLEPKIYPTTSDFQQAVGGIPLISQLLYRRGLNDITAAKGFLDESLYQPASPLELPDLEKSVEFLLTAIKEKKRISIWGDFDVDGQTSTTLLVSIFRELGAIVDYHIPVRAYESHGINLAHLEKLLENGTQVLITCDTGITATDEVDYAQTRDIPVIITDHHDLPPQLPKAYAVINPKRLPLDHPMSNLPGVGVAYQLIEQLCRRIGRPDLPQTCLDLVALGIVADLAIIKGDTRWLLQQGLKVLRNAGRIGLKMLYEMIELNPEHITEEHISFYVAPRLNAIGRLSDANPIVEFLTTLDIGKARLMAVELEGLNAQRKLMTDQVFQAAQAQLDSNPRQLEKGVIMLHNPNWPAGVIGIVASRLVERYKLPTILLSTPPGQPARGSARSVEGINITEAIAANKNFLIGFGGHPMAAGLSIKAEKIPEFHQALTITLKETGGEDKAAPVLQIDSYYPLSDLSLDLVAQIERLSPFGPGNPAPLLATRRLNLAGYTSVGRNAEHLLLSVEDETGFTQKVIWWQGADWPVPQGKFDMAYVVRATTYRGQQDMQIEWVDYRPIIEESIPLISPRKPLHITDFRQETNPISAIDPLLRQESIQIWCEAISVPRLQGLNRHKLVTPCKVLAIWTIPPGLSELRAVLEKILPEEIYFFGVNPGLDQPDAFLKRLAGLVKYALRSKCGKVKLSELAAASAHRIQTIQTGISWLEAHGHITVIEQNGDDLVVQEGTRTLSNNSRQTAQQLKALLAETAAFRDYYLIANTDALINL